MLTTVVAAKGALANLPPILAGKSVTFGSVTDVPADARLDPPALVTEDDRVMFELAPSVLPRFALALRVDVAFEVERVIETLSVEVVIEGIVLDMMASR